MVGKAIVDLRSLTTGYYGEGLLENGLIKAIKREALQLEKTGLFSVHFSTEITEIELEKNKAIFLYRMIQEILNNILKHSEAKNVNITILHDKEVIHIKIADDGKGFDKKDPAFKPGIGLSSLQKRAAMINVNLIIESEKNIGTSVELIFQ